MSMNIKSSYLIKFLFSYITEKQKLKLIKYNINLQKTLDITLFNYKYFTGKYIIYDDNSKKTGKEYLGPNDLLVFEGEYLNGKRNGKGKEYSYFTSVLLFEGEYLNGKRNGKGKEYEDGHGSLKFEGEYLNGKRNGKGKEYYSDYRNELQIIFDGEYLDDRELIGIKYDKYGKLLDNFNHTKGIGKEYNSNGDLIYEGEFLNGKRNGKGKEYYFYNRLTFEGEFLNDIKWTGKGYDKSNNIIFELKNGKGFVKEYDFDSLYLQYEGEYLYGKRNGKGKEYWNDELRYEGEYLNGEKHGKGKEYFRGVLVFEGEYLNGKRKGQGKEYYEDSKIRFEGEYLYEFLVKGKLYLNKKLEYEGDYLYLTKFNGKGYDENGNVIYELINGNGKVKEYYQDGALQFEGKYLNGKRSGKGKQYNGDTLKYEGEYLNGKKHGFGKEYGSYGKLKYEGEFLNGNKHGKGKEYNLSGKIIYEGEYLNGEKLNK